MTTPTLAAHLALLTALTVATALVHSAAHHQRRTARRNATEEPK